MLHVLCGSLAGTQAEELLNSICHSSLLSLVAVQDYESGIAVQDGLQYVYNSTTVRVYRKRPRPYVARYKNVRMDCPLFLAFLARG